MTRGTAAITAMFLVGLAMASFAWWARYHQGLQVLDAWGPNAALAVRKGQRVELWRLRAADEDEQAAVAVSAAVGGSAEPVRLAIAESTDISDAAGLIHCRHHLLHRSAFAWNEVTPVGDPLSWRWGLRFEHQDTTATILFDSDHDWGYLVEPGVRVSIAPIADALRTFVTEL